MRRDHHPRQPWMERQLADLLTDRRKLPLLDRPKLAEQIESSLDPISGRVLEPLERAQIASPGHDVEHRRGQIDTPHFRLAVWTEDVALIPKTRGPSGRGAAGAAGA